MKITGVIAEFNPFHNGHAYLCNKIKEQNSYVVAIMSPNIVQRGEFAWIPKIYRVQAALACGVDLVLELPSIYALSTAERFSFGAISILGAMGCVDQLSFGTEYSDISLLQQTATAIDSKDTNYLIGQYLQTGISFATARTLAVEQLYGAAVAQCLKAPNSILGVEYIRQIQKQNLGLQPYPVHRIGIGHDSEKQYNGIASATFLRKSYDLDIWKQFTPKNAMPFYQKAYEDGAYLDPIKQEIAILTCLRQLKLIQIQQLPDVCEGIEHRLFRAIANSTTIQQVYDGVKTKRYPLSKIRRLVMNAFLQTDATLLYEKPPYIRILGIGEQGPTILKKAKTTTVIPMGGQLLQLEKTSENAKRFADHETKV
ncbi:MAG: nucleotidyltransferase family protein, partial [Oscillospiraceae bacterium]